MVVGNVMLFVLVFCDEQLAIGYLVDPGLVLV